MTVKKNMARNSGLSEYPKLLGEKKKKGKIENRFQVHHGCISGK